MATENLGLKDTFADGDTLPADWLNTVADELDAASEAADTAETAQSEGEETAVAFRRLLLNLTQQFGFWVADGLEAQLEMAAAEAKGG